MNGGTITGGGWNVQNTSSMSLTSPNRAKRDAAEAERAAVIAELKVLMRKCVERHNTRKRSALWFDVLPAHRDYVEWWDERMQYLLNIRNNLYRKEQSQSWQTKKLIRETEHRNRSLRAGSRPSS